MYAALQRGLTLLETCIGGGVLLLLASAGLWGLSHAREEARATICSTILARYGEAFAAYAADHSGVLPYESVDDEDSGRIAWYFALESYLGAPERMCPSVEKSEGNWEEGYRMNSKLCRKGTAPPAPYRVLASLYKPSATAVLFDGEYGGKKLSLKGQLKDADFRHNGAVNLLLADWHVERFKKKRLVEESGWLPPTVIWDPNPEMLTIPQATKKRP